MSDLKAYGSENDDDNFDEDDDDVSQQEQIFNRAAQYLATNVGSFDQGILLEIYGLYKQSTVGDCNTSKPGLFSIQAKAKWNAWNDLKGLSSKDAMIKYIEKITKINPNWDSSEQSGSGKKPSGSQWISVSRHAIGEEDADVPDTDKTLFDFVKEDQTNRLTETLKQISSEQDLNLLDTSGLGLIHWAADRGNVNALQILLKHGINVDLRDSDGQTALHYAASVDHLECVKLLIKFGADRTIFDNDGQTCLSVANNSIISDLLKS